MSSWRIVTMSALDYSHQDYFMKTVKNKTFIQFRSVKLGSFCYRESLTINNTNINPVIRTDYFVVILPVIT